MGVNYGLLAANLNPGTIPLAQIQAQKQIASANLGLGYAQMGTNKRLAQQQMVNQQAMQQASLSQQAAMQSQQLTQDAKNKAMALAQQDKESLLPYQAMTAAQQQQGNYEAGQLGIQQQQVNQQSKQFQLEQQRAANQLSFEQQKMEYEMMQPQSAEAKFARDFQLQTDPQARQIMLEQKMADYAKNNEIVTTDKDGNMTVQRGGMLGGMGAAGGAGGGGGGAGRFVGQMLMKNVADQQQLSDLDAIEQSYDPKFSTNMSALQGKVAGVAGRMGLESRLPQSVQDTVAKRNAWESQVNQYFAQQKSELGQNGTAPSTLDAMKDTLINSAQDPSKFEATMKVTKDKLSRYVQIRNQALGIGLKPGTPPFSEYMNKQSAVWNANSPVNDATTLSRFAVKPSSDAPSSQPQIQGQ